VSRKNGGWCQVYHTAQHGVQVTPLARPQTCGVFGISRVPSLVAVKKPASGAPDAQRWAAKEKPPRAEHGTGQPGIPGIPDIPQPGIPGSCIPPRRKPPRLVLAVAGHRPDQYGHVSYTPQSGTAPINAL